MNVMVAAKYVVSQKSKFISNVHTKGGAGFLVKGPMESRNAYAPTERVKSKRDLMPLLLLSRAIIFPLINTVNSMYEKAFLFGQL